MFSLSPLGIFEHGGVWLGQALIVCVRVTLKSRDIPRSIQIKGGGGAIAHRVGLDQDGWSIHSTNIIPFLHINLCTVDALYKCHTFLYVIPIFHTLRPEHWASLILPCYSFCLELSVMSNQAHSTSRCIELMPIWRPNHQFKTNCRPQNLCLLNLLL